MTPCKENGGQSSELVFYGKSFITDETGAILTEADRNSDAILTAEFDFNKIREERLSWGLFRDRRPECYNDITN